MSRLITLLFGAAAGAAAAHFLDPESGTRRRNTLRDRATSKARQGKEQAVRQADHATAKAKVDVVESMGSELYIYFDVQTQQEVQSDDLAELAKDAGMEDLPTHGEGQQVVARLSAESKAAPGEEIEMTLELTNMKLFATDTGKSMTETA